MTKYRIGDRCPDCGEHFRELVRLLPTQEEYDRGLREGFSTTVVCPNKHEHEPHPDWLEAPYPAAVWET